MTALRNIHELFERRELLWVWTLREVSARYKQSLFGFVWAIFQPIALTVVFVLAFSYFIKLPSDGLPYPIFVYSAMLPWTFFTRSLAMGVPSIVGNMNLVTKIYLPRAMFPLAAIATSLVDFFCGLLVFIGLMVYYQFPLNPAMGLLPLLFLIQLGIMAGVSLGASAVNVVYRDISQMIPVLLQLWMYACPIVYPLSIVPEWLRPFYMLNPMAVAINGYRETILQAQLPNLQEVAIAAIISLIVLIIGYFTFNLLEDKFADII